MGNNKSTPFNKSSKQMGQGRDKRARDELSRLQNDLDGFYDFLVKVKQTKEGTAILDDYILKQMANVSDSEEMFLMEVTESSCTNSIASSKTRASSSRMRYKML
jgi:hypothetical protein